MDDICSCLGKPLSFVGSNVWKLTQVVLNLKWSHLLQGPCVFRLNWWPLSAPPGALYIIMHTSDSFDFHSAQCKCVATVALKRYCRVNATKSNSCKSCYFLNKEVPRKNVLRNKHANWKFVMTVMSCEYDAVSDLVVIPFPRRSEIQDQ